MIKTCVILPLDPTHTVAADKSTSSFVITNVYICLTFDNKGTPKVLHVITVVHPFETDVLIAWKQGRDNEIGYQI